MIIDSVITIDICLNICYTICSRSIRVKPIRSESNLNLLAIPVWHLRSSPPRRGKRKKPDAWLTGGKLAQPADGASATPETEGGGKR